MSGLRWALIALCLPYSTAWASQVYFSSDQNVEVPIIEMIDHAHQSIDAALYELNSPPLIRALQRAAGRGVRVQVLMQRGSRVSGLSTVFNSVEIHWLGGRSPHGIMHHKFAIFDGERVETGSYNWTEGARHANYENALLEDDANVVRGFMQQFGLLWKRSSGSVDDASPGRMHRTSRGRTRRRSSRRLKKF